MFVSLFAAADGGAARVNPRLGSGGVVRQALWHIEPDK